MFQFDLPKKKKSFALCIRTISLKSRSILTEQVLNSSIPEIIVGTADGYEVFEGEEKVIIVLIDV